MAPEPGRIKHKDIEVRRCTGKDSVEDYLLQFELTTRHSYWTDQEKASSLLFALDGPARGVLAEIDDITRVSYQEVRWALPSRFGPADLPATHEQALQQLRRNPGQNIRELSQEVQKLTRRAYSDLAGRTQNQLMVGFFLRAISDRDAVFHIRDKEPRTLDDVCTLYERFRLLSNPESQRLPTAHIEERDETEGAARMTEIPLSAIAHCLTLCRPSWIG